jgi:hypothetical protein
VQGPRDVVGDAHVAALDDDLRRACLRALEVPREKARAFALTRSWRTCTEQFLSNLPVKVCTADPEADGAVEPEAPPLEPAAVS